MRAALVGLIVGIVIVAIIIFWVIGVYNKLVQLAVRVENAFSQIDVQLQRRYDLIPNLVETAKGYMQHERETLENVIAARNQAQGALQKAERGEPGGMAELSSAEGQLGGALSRLLVTVEAYPDLKANQNMMQLNEELTSTENKVSFARQAYNDAVSRFNAARQSFPANAVAGMFDRFKRDREFFEIPEEKAEQVREAPKVSFS